ncbi:MAG: sigma-70 family RNA polymerase sigma factor [Bacteroidales bacterium]|nr:sigma-70 family RNA polymerase sigma factor [Bacteroidales bacterium]
MNKDKDTAFAELVERQRTLLWHVCSDYSLSAAWTVEDAMQEVLCVLWNDFDTFQHRSSESTWVYRVATTTMLHLKRRQVNQPQGEMPEHHNPAAEDNENYHHLLQLIDNLPEQDRQIVRAHLDGFSQIEIARIVGCSLPTVTRHLARSKKILRKQYEQTR